MSWFPSYRTSESPKEITDGNGDTLTPSEIEAEHGRRR